MNKTVARNLCILGLAGSLLAGTASTVLAKDMPMVPDASQGNTLPTEVSRGSVTVSGEQESAWIGQAKLSAAEALQAAARASSGKVVEVQLGDENGFLVWEVTQIDPAGGETQIKIDAGNGQLLAMEKGDDQADKPDASEDKADEDHHDETGDEGESSGWKFWEWD